MYNVEETVSVQHELLPRVSVSGGWYHREYFNLRRRFNTGVALTDFTPFTLLSPIDNSQITYYNVSAAKASQLASNLIDGDAPDRSMKYNGYEYNFNARLTKGITIFGGGMTERMLTNTCDDGWNPNLLLYCDQSKNSLPFRTQFKLAGTVPVKYGVQVGVAFQSLPGYLFGTSSQYALTGVSGPSGITTNNPPAGASSVWLITKTTKYGDPMYGGKVHPCVAAGLCDPLALVDPGMTQASLSVPLVAPMTEYGDRINQLDLNITKTFKFNRFSFQPKIDFFNLLNVSSVTNVLGLNFGTQAFKQPSVVVNGRVFQLGGMIKF
jgi:hypothetical protein